MMVYSCVHSCAPLLVRRLLMRPFYSSVYSIHPSIHEHPVGVMRVFKTEPRESVESKEHGAHTEHDGACGGGHPKYKASIFEFYTHTHTYTSKRKARVLESSIFMPGLRVRRCWERSALEVEGSAQSANRT